MSALKMTRLLKKNRRPVLPIGESDYKTVIEDNYYYIDKTSFIKDVLPKTAPRVMLITRPRRFGKTLNLSMLQYFFEKTEESNQHLFEHTKIWRSREAREHQGKYPVIFLTFKEVKFGSWQQAYKRLCDLISVEFGRHKNFVADILTDEEKVKYTNILNGTADSSIYASSLQLLSQILHRKAGQKVIFLLDEYDSPITHAYQEGFYDQLMDFMRALLGAVLKDSRSLASGVITGISRIAKEGVFSGLNNIVVYGVVNDFASDKFGFTQAEVRELLIYYHLSKQAKVIKEWFDGYTIGKTKNIYNPWSVINCVHNKGALEPYWGLTSNNNLLRDLFIQTNAEVKEDLELLLQGQSISCQIEQGIVFPGIERNPNALWTLLLYTGYLTMADHKLENGRHHCSLKLPNREMKEIYQSVINTFFIDALNSNKLFPRLVKALVGGQAEDFAETLQEVVMRTMSFLDVDRRTPENKRNEFEAAGFMRVQRNLDDASHQNVYHMFLAGTIVATTNDYQVTSNRESGLGKPDIMLMPHDHKRPGVIIEIKKVRKGQKIKALADLALEQIKEHSYVTELRARGIKKIFAYGLAFEGKKLEVRFAEMA